MNIKLIIAYRGTHFSGWQKTGSSATPSIEETLESALAQILRHKIKLQAASRTDAGVHAEGQAVNFFLQAPLPLPTLVRSLNGVLPDGIRVHCASEMPFDFHPTLDCKKKEYHYHICNAPFQLPFYKETSWHFIKPLDLEKMEEAASALLGTHDFSSFCNERSLWDRNPICTLESITITSLPHNRLKIAVIGDHFLYKMVRNIAGTLAYCGCGKLSPEEIPAILASKSRARNGVTAPACGLTLKQLFYN